MTIGQIDSRLKETLTNVGLNLSSLTDQARFIKDLGLDSLGVTDLLIQVEFNFGIRIPDEYWWKLQTIGQLKDYLSAELTVDADPIGGTKPVAPGNVYSSPFLTLLWCPTCFI